MKLATVGELMTKDVISIDPDLKVDIAVELMNSHNIRRLPVVSKVNRVIGVISINDAMLAISEAKDALRFDDNAIPIVRDAMADIVYTVGPDESVAKAAQMMVNHEIGCLPVLDKEKNLVGIITESDLFRYLAQMLGNEDTTAAA